MRCDARVSAQEVAAALRAQVDSLTAQLAEAQERIAHLEASEAKLKKAVAALSS